MLQKTATDLLFYYCENLTMLVFPGLSRLIDHGFVGQLTLYDFVQLWSRGRPNLILGGGLRPFIGSCAAWSYTDAVSAGQQATDGADAEQYCTYL